MLWRNSYCTFFISVTTVDRMSVIGEFIRANKPKTTKRCLESNGALVQYGVVVGIVGVMLMIGSSNLPLLGFFSLTS